MNLQNMQILHDWLMAGAPHVTRFDMSLGLEALYQDPSEPACGTVCCIAGAADLFSISGDGTMPSTAEQAAHARRISWLTVRGNALDWLGLPPKMVEAYGSAVPTHIGHDLFDMNLAPKDCTPEQAAAAVKRVMNGEFPWPDAQFPDPEDA